MTSLLATAAGLFVWFLTGWGDFSLHVITDTSTGFILSFGFRLSFSFCLWRNGGAKELQKIRTDRPRSPRRPPKQVCLRRRRHFCSGPVCCFVVESKITLSFFRTENCKTLIMSSPPLLQLQPPPPLKDVNTQKRNILSEQKKSAEMDGHDGRSIHISRLALCLEEVL